MREVVKEEVDTALEPIHQKLDALSGSVIQIETTLDTRVTKLEDNAGIVPPPEFTIQK